MRATLTLDNDVAILLDRARKEQGRSLEEMANELLRRTLEHLGASPATRRRTQIQDPESDAAEILRLEAKINQIYDELRDLVGRSVEEPGLANEVERKREQLHALQMEEATAMRRQAESRLHLKPGEGYQLLERVGARRSSCSLNRS